MTIILTKKRQELLLCIRKAYTKRIRNKPFAKKALRLIWNAKPNEPRKHTVSPFDSRYERGF